MKKSKVNILLCICVLIYSLFDYMSVYANVYFKTTCERIRQINIHRSEVRCGSAFEPLPYYCTPPVCVPAVPGALVVWRLSKKNENPYYCTSTCVRSWCNWRASYVDSKRRNKKKKAAIQTNKQKRWCPFSIYSSNAGSRLHCSDACLTWYLWDIKVWWRHLHRQCEYHPDTLPCPTGCV